MAAPMMIPLLVIAGELKLGLKWMEALKQQLHFQTLDEAAT